MQKISNRAFLACLLAVLMAVPLGVALWSRKDTTAYYETRALAPFPDLTWESLWDGSFGSAFENWWSDHAPGRTTLLKADTAVQMNLLKRPVVNGAVVGGEVLLPFLEYKERPADAYPGPAARVAANFAKLEAHIQANGGAFYFAGFPEQRVYFKDAFPSYLNSHENEAQAADTAFAAAMEREGITFLDMGRVYDALGHPADFYSVVDHHYNGYGAYAAYRAILDAMNADGFDLPVLTEEKMDLRELPNPYIGSRNRKVYNLWPNRDRPVLTAQKEPIPFTRWDNGEPSDKPLFVLPAAEDLPTTYNLYMGGDFGETILKTDRPELPDLLIFGDSFTNALETMLYASFDETRSLDLRQYTEQSLKDYISEYQPDVVLCVLNDTFYYTTTGNGNVWGD